MRVLPPLQHSRLNHYFPTFSAVKPYQLCHYLASYDFVNVIVIVIVIVCVCVCVCVWVGRLTTVPRAVPGSVLEQHTRHPARSLADCRSGAFPLHRR